MTKGPTLTAVVQELITRVDALLNQIRYNDTKLQEMTRERDRWRAHAEGLYRASVLLDEGVKVKRAPRPRLRRR